MEREQQLQRPGGGKQFWRSWKKFRSTLLSAEILGHLLWSMMKLVLGACVLYKEAEDSDPQQARYTVGAQLMFVDERMNKAKNWKGFEINWPRNQKLKFMQGCFT